MQKSLMSRDKRPVCIGLFGAEEECNECNWRQSCKEMSERITSAATRKGTHVRITSKYKEKKYKPKKIP